MGCSARTGPPSCRSRCSASLPPARGATSCGRSASRATSPGRANTCWGEHLPPRCGQDHICGLERGAAGSVLPQRGRGRTGGGGGGTGRPASRLARPGEILLRVLADAAPVQAGEAEGPSRPQGVRGARPHGDRGQLPVLRGRDEDLTSLVPGRRGPRRVDLQGTEVGLVHAAAEGLPGRASPAPSGRGVPGEGGPGSRRGPTPSHRGRRGGTGVHPGDVRGRPPGNPDEAMTGGLGASRYAGRLDRAARAAGDAGLGALLVTPGPDLLYLTGHGPPPLERLTLLVIAPGRGPVLLVPLLERPAALASPAADRIEVLGWADGEDPYAVAAGLLPPGLLGVTDQTWASHVLGLQEAAADRTLVAAGRTMPPLRAVKDEEELAVLARAASAADAAFD